MPTLKPRDKALTRADDAQRCVLDLEQEIRQLKKYLVGTGDHVASEVECEVNENGGVGPCGVRGECASIKT